MLAVARRILGLSWPILIAQLAYMGVAVADTVFAGRYATTHLAAVAVGSAIQITVAFTLTGILQALSPVVAHHLGAGREDGIAGAWRQGMWLAAVLSILGFLLLVNPRPWIALSGPAPEVAELAARYLHISAWALPAHLLYRGFYAFTTALGRPRAVMAITTTGALINVPLSYALIFGKLGVAPLGALGCALANVMVAWGSLGCALLLLAISPAYRGYRVFSHWEPPRRRVLAELLHIGLPMGLSNLVEISSFTFIALFIAPLGADVQAGHRIVANLVSLCFMGTLSIGLSTTALVGQAVGGRDFDRARVTSLSGFLMAVLLASVLAALITLFARPIVFWYSRDAAVHVVALHLVGYAAVFHLFDAAQAVSAFALRGYKATLAPMLAHMLCFWGVGLGAGWWLAFRTAPPMGAAGFWLAAVASLMLATLLVGGYLLLVLRARR